MSNRIKGKKTQKFKQICLHNNFILFENELGTFALVKVASMQWETLVKT